MYDLEALKAQTDCREVAASLLGQPQKHSQGRDLYPCPFHDEKTASFWVYKDGWTCFGKCACSGSVVDLVVKVKGLDFKAACEYLGASRFVSDIPQPRKPATKPDAMPPDDNWRYQAAHVCNTAKHYLFSQAGKPAMRYLTEVRKLEQWAIWEAKLGYIPLPAHAKSHLHWRNYDSITAPCGITIPSIDPDKLLWGVKVRLPKPLSPDDSTQKYSSFKGGKLTGSLFGGDKFRPELPVYLDEGEFNALAVWGCRYDLRNAGLNTMALSSVNNELSKAWLDRLLFAPVVFVRTDAGSGDKVAEQLQALSKRFVRVQVPESYKDPNDFLIAEGKPALIEWVRGFLQ